MKKKFLNHLHTHSHFSSLDGLGSPDAFVEVAKEQGSTAISLTEHGTLRGIYDTHKACKDAGIKFIPGVEMYLCRDMKARGLSSEEEAQITAGLKRGEQKQALFEEERRRGLLDRHHLTILAMNEVGFQNLMTITNKGWLEGFYKRPRIDLKCLYDHNEGLIVLSGCNSGLVSREVLKEDPRGAELVVDSMRDVLGDRLYIEVMPHFSEEVKPTTGPLFELAKRMKMPVVATQDAHYPCNMDWEFQETMLAIRTRDSLLNPRRFRFGKRDFYLKGYEEMLQAFREQGHVADIHAEGFLDQSIEIAERCSANLPLGRKPFLPRPRLPEGWTGTEAEYLEKLAFEGLRRHLTKDRLRTVSSFLGMNFQELVQTYQERIRFELDTVKERGLERYFLMVAEMYEHVHERGIPTGYGRGSAGGSLLARVLRIVAIDPIEHKLLFSRFLSPGRKDSLPDIDSDFADTHRELVIQYLRDRYGDSCVARIGTIGTLKGRGAVREISKVLLIPESEYDPVTKFIEEEIGEDRPESSYGEAVRLAFDDNKEDPEWDPVRRFHSLYPYVLHLARHLEGATRSLGLHAAGVVVADRPLEELVPLEIREHESKSKLPYSERKKESASEEEPKPKGKKKKPTVVATGLTMEGVEKFALVKVDILGVKNITMVWRTLLSLQRFKKHWWDEAPPEDMRDFLYQLEEMRGIPLNDRVTLDAFSAGLFAGIFQYDTPSMRRLCEGVVFRSFDDVAALVAVVRPGTSRSELGARYLEHRRTGIIPPVHPAYDEICAETYGIPIYQEQFTQIFERMGGYTPAEADALRKVCAKKHGATAVMAEEEKFVTGCGEVGFEKADARKLLEDLANFGAYSFNKAHSAAYALLSYVQMFLKMRFKPEFFAAVLASDPDLIEDEEFIRELRVFGVRAGGVDINHAGEVWEPSPDGRILAPLTSVKGVGEAAFVAIHESRPFESLEDFGKRVKRRGCNARVVKVLRDAGAFRLMGNPSEAEIVDLWERTAPKAPKKEKQKKEAPPPKVEILKQEDLPFDPDPVEH